MEMAPPVCTALARAAASAPAEAPAKAPVGGAAVSRRSARFCKRTKDPTRFVHPPQTFIPINHLHAASSQPASCSLHQAAKTAKSSKKAPAGTVFTERMGKLFSDTSLSLSYELVSKEEVENMSSTYDDMMKYEGYGAKDLRVAVQFETQCAPLPPCTPCES